MCGPSAQQKQLAGEEGGFFNTLMSSYNTNFANQQGILSNITNALTPILNAGPNQPGYSPSTVADLRSSAINNTAAQARNASVVAGEAGSEGGNTGVTTGGQAQLQAGIASQAGQNLSSELTNIDLSNYAAGRENFFTAENALGGVSSQYNPVAYAGQATGAGGTAFGEATTVRNMQNQEQADIGGLVPGLAGGTLDFLNNSNFGGNLFGGNVFGPGGALG